MTTKKDIVLCIAGSRHFTNYKLFLHILQIKMPEIEKYGNIVKIIEGDCPNGGVDAMAKRYAIANNIKHESYTPDWDKHGLPAGPIRNSKMSEVADVLFLYHMGGKGSKDVKKKFLSKNKPVVEVRV